MHSSNIQTRIIGQFKYSKTGMTLGFESFEFMRSKSSNSLKKLVKIKTKEYALSHLLSLKAKHTKMDKLVYCELKLQKYLKSDYIPV